ncbi:MAG: biopolymer transporter ExbD [Planctomycetes bacterium]|nr:biopolymer transporter ExbD [Planctomycetota bacterium]
MRRKRKKRSGSQEEVTLNLAAMLDMAFQLLAFFILTFKPSPVEGQINLNLPPPRPILPPEQIQKPETEEPEGDGPAAAHTLTITINSAGNGQVASMQVGLAKLFDGGLTADRLRILDRRLKDVFAIEGKPYDQVLLRVGKSLAYGELMKIIDVCTKQKMSDGTPVNKISFVELPEN